MATAFSILYLALTLVGTADLVNATHGLIGCFFTTAFAFTTFRFIACLRCVTGITIRTWLAGTTTLAFTTDPLIPGNHVATCQFRDAKGILLGISDTVT